MDINPTEEARDKDRHAVPQGRMCASLARLTEMQDNQVVLRILRFFCQNRYTIDTADSIAIWAGFPRERAHPALNALVEAQFLERVGEGDNAVYLVASGLTAGRFPDFEEIECLIKE